MALTEKQKKFVDEYLIDLNATHAYLRAGYKCTEEAARRNASRLLTNADIVKEIEKHTQKRSERTEVTQDRVLLEIARLAFSDPRKAFNEDGTLKPVHDWPDEVAAAISSIKVNETATDDGLIVQTKEIKFWDKGKQLDLAARHLGMLDDKLRLLGDKNEPINHKVVFEVISGNSASRKTN